MARKSSRRLTEQERAERRRQDRERLQIAAEQLLTSDGWKRWVRVRSQAGLARLSISNQLLVALARPDATFVAGFNTWIRLGYAVRKGERAVAIIAPLPVKERDRSTGEETGDTMMLFKTVFVFDRLSRVRSGDVVDVRSGDPLPVGLPLVVARPRAPGTREGTGFGLRGRRGAGARRATAQRRSRARLAGDPSANKGAMSRRRECRHRVPQPESRGPRARPPKAAAFHEMEPGPRLERSWLVLSGTSRRVAPSPPPRSWLLPCRSGMLRGPTPGSSEEATSSASVVTAVLRRQGACSVHGRWPSPIGHAAALGGGRRAMEVSTDRRSAADPGEGLPVRLRPSALAERTER